jgi:hypothetical protein
MSNVNNNYHIFVLEKHNHVNYKQIIFPKRLFKKLTSVDRKFPYHIANLFFKEIKVLIHFILFSSLVCVHKPQLQGQHLSAKDVIDKYNLINILKFMLTTYNKDIY